RALARASGGPGGGGRGRARPPSEGGGVPPPIAANLTVLCFGQVCSDAMIQTRQRLVCHRSGRAGMELITSGVVQARYEKRGREYVDVATTVSTSDGVLWESEVSFTPAATL